MVLSADIMWEEVAVAARLSGKIQFPRELFDMC